MATSKNFIVKNGLEVGGREVIDSSGRLLIGTTNYDGSALQINANSVGSSVYTAYINNSSTSTSAYNAVRWAQGAAGSATGMIGTGGSAVGNPAFRNTFVVGTQSSNSLVFATGDTERARIDTLGNLLVGRTGNSGYGKLNVEGGADFTGGNVLLARDTGNVGIGTASPSTKLHLGGTAPLDSIIRQDSTVSGTNWEIGERAAGKWQIWEDDTDSVVATFMSTGNVGLGTSSPAELLDVRGTVSVSTKLKSSKNIYDYLEFDDDVNFNGGLNTTVLSSIADIAFVANGNDGGGGDIIFWYGSAASGGETARIDTSGNLLVGKTASNYGTEGVEIRSNEALITRDGGTVLSLNRLTSDGLILGFAKDTTTVGSIGVETGSIYIQGNAVSSGFLFGNSNIYPWDAGALSDAGIDLGSSSYRFKDLYLSGGVVLGSTGGNVTDKTLDDYEEGNWSPVLQGQTSGTYTMGGITAGRYTKVGRLVTVTCQIQWTAGSGYSGNLIISGLPYACQGSRAAGSLSAVSSGISMNSPYDKWLDVIVDPTRSFMYIIANGNGTYTHGPNVASSGIIYGITLTYQTS